MAEQRFCFYNGEPLKPSADSIVMANNLRVVRNAIKVLKRLDADSASSHDMTFSDIPCVESDKTSARYMKIQTLHRLVENSGGAGRDMVNKFSRIASKTDAEAKENTDIVSWFLNIYFPENSKVYELTAPARENIAEMCAYLIYHPEADSFSVL